MVNLFVFISPVGEWQVHLITDMSQLFLARQNCIPNIEQWNVSNVSNFVSGCNDHNIQYFDYLFLLLNLHSHHLKFVIHKNVMQSLKEQMFFGNNINIPLNGWNMSSATNLVSQATRRVNDHHVLSCT